VPDLPPRGAGAGQEAPDEPLAGRLRPGEVRGWPSAREGPGMRSWRWGSGWGSQSSPAGCGSGGSSSWCKHASRSQGNFSLFGALVTQPSVQGGLLLSCKAHSPVTTQKHPPGYPRRSFPAFIGGTHAKPLHRNPHRVQFQTSLNHTQRQ